MEKYAYFWNFEIFFLNKLRKGEEKNENKNKGKNIYIKIKIKYLQKHATDTPPQALKISIVLDAWRGYGTISEGLAGPDVVGIVEGTVDSQVDSMVANEQPGAAEARAVKQGLGACHS